MNAAWYIGRIGGLAVALGVGAALFTGNGIAWAGPDSDDSSVSSESGSPGQRRVGLETGEEDPSGSFWPHQDLDTVRIDRRLNITRRRGQLTDRPEDIGGHTRRPPVRLHPGAAISIGHQRVDIDDTAAQEEPVAVELDRLATPSASISARTISGKDAINDVVVKAQSTVTSLLKPSVAVPQIASTPSTLPLVSIVKNFPVTRSAMVTPQSATPNAAQPTHSVAECPCHCGEPGIEPIRGDDADHAAGGPARYLGAARRAAPGTVRCRCQS